MSYKLPRKYLNVLLAVGIVAAAIGVLYLLFTTVLKWFLPFILAYILAYITNPLVAFMEKKLKIPRRIASAITVLFVLLLLGAIVTFIIYRIIYEIEDLTEQLPGLFNAAKEQISILFDRGFNLYINLPVEISQFIDTVMNDITKNLSSMLKPITDATLNFAGNFASALPSILIFIIVLFISTYFISSDKDKIGRFIRKQFPEIWIERILSIKSDLIFALLGYIKAQLILMSITFIEVSIGLLIIGIDYAILLALLISIIDALPILGTGTVLIPWALVAFVMGNFPMGLSLIILYGIVLLVRQLLEPKIVGGQIGLYPLVTLMSMYVGLQIFGVVGMILGPVTILIIKNLQRAGLIRLWKE